ncbi:MAG: SAM-dependent methyltransferase [Bacteroidetes bacterium]|nr:MAG: SAM-dependent methyltransferase [Bacteroidota bacterium]
MTTSEGKVRKDGRRKFRQINKYLELIGHLLEEHPLPNPAHLVDMGSGKGYLTFALYDYLRHAAGLAVSLTGIELRPQLVAAANALAQREGFEHLRFVAQDIHDYQPAQSIDMLIALHACDTATDEALAKGIRAQAELIVVAPCCHQQVRKSMEIPADLNPMLRHGILLERQAEMLTDAIRALLLEAHGYRVKVFEFVGTEHTPKNVMITATKASSRPKALAEVESLKQQFGIRYHHLERLLAANG